jgi:REP element-mobilizing transposase RayT
MFVRGANQFFKDGDYALYRDLLAERCRKASVACWAYYLMPNHVHLVLAPATADGLARAIGEMHRQYTGVVSTRMRWTGHLTQGRFSSVALDEEHPNWRPATWLSIPCGLRWCNDRRIGPGPACGRISPVAMTDSSPARACSSGFAISRHASTPSRGRPC